MSEDIQNTIRLFRLYKKLPYEYKKEFKLLLTPENILNASTSTDKNTFVETNTNNSISGIDNMTIKELSDNLENDEGTIFNSFVFNNIMKQLKVYISLRPQLIEDHPEYLL
jgi:hypothetical protein